VHRKGYKVGILDADDTGPIINNTVKQFYQDIIWEEID